MRIETGSDDCIEVDGVKNQAGIDTCAQDGHFGEFVIGDLPNGPAARIELHYTTDVGARFGACWAAVVGPAGEDVPMPAVMVSSTGYNVVVDVQCPPGTPVVYGLREEGRICEAPIATVST